ncbi:polyphosphate kinase 1 [Helicobacter cetorum]|uniref:Polyphosphate kinase n=1 Tax=Helicobacter cetorum (strain ATCC BAA-540 / CCUG 52418 / MIT 99-5656) TaxID=1163745 RepID=I0ETD7_HELCM|nr:polyphosphate kinase 1 [Helicobacter cetorum]AFI06206.1 polyphosphate kinase [Helicobacter cetorum MIT 99-5656]
MNHFFNRELSWLAFNTRVLNEAKDESLPLLERLKFLAIYSTNLDEFYMIRVAGLKQLYEHKIISRGTDNTTPEEQLEKIERYLALEIEEMELEFQKIQALLAQKKLCVSAYNKLTPLQKAKAKNYFLEQLYALVLPFKLDSSHTFPPLSNLTFALFAKIKEKKTQNISYALIKLPTFTARFIELEKGLFVLAEEIVEAHLQDLFLGHEVLECMAFRVTCDADIEIAEDEAHDYVDLMSEGLRKRNQGEIVRLQTQGGSQELLNTLLASLRSFQTHFHDKLKLSGMHIYKSATMLGLGDLWELVNHSDFKTLKSPNFTPKILPPLDESDLFKAIEEQDLLLFHPYESFEPVIDLIEQATNDPTTLSIKMTLYRVGKHSPIVKALIEAASKIQVSVLVELKARFDEESNLHWAKALEKAGALVVYGILKLKVHAKMLVITKRIDNRLCHFTHLSTGNYNPLSARIYTDVSFFSAKNEIANDIIKLFHSLLTSSATSNTLNTLFMAPKQIKNQIIELIQNEIKHSKEGYIILKANALVDSEIIEWLYKASQKGVKIDLIIRGVCCLKPLVKGLSENIRVYSIVGKYLEHARIYYFKHTNIYFSSADLMPRNLERRVELLIPATSPKIANKLLRILEIQLKDTMKRYELDSKGNYTRISNPNTPLNSQDYFEAQTLKMGAYLDEVED